MPGTMITTGISTLVNLVRKKGRIKLSHAAKILDMDVDSLEELVKILEDQGIIRIDYSFMGDKILKKGEKIDEDFSDKKIEKRRVVAGRDGGPDGVDKVLGLIKTRIAKKKMGVELGKAEIDAEGKRIEEELAKEELGGEEGEPEVKKPDEEEKPEVKKPEEEEKPEVKKPEEEREKPEVKKPDEEREKPEVKKPDEEEKPEVKKPEEEREKPEVKKPDEEREKPEVKKPEEEREKPEVKKPEEEGEKKEEKKISLEEELKEIDDEWKKMEETWSEDFKGMDDEWKNLDGTLKEVKSIDAPKEKEKEPEKLEKPEPKSESVKMEEPEESDALLDTAPKAAKRLGLTDKLRLMSYSKSAGVINMLDGKKTLREISRELSMNSKEMIELVKILEKKGYIKSK